MTEEYYNEDIGQAFDQAFINDWQPLIHKIINKYRGMPKFHYEEEDMEQEGMIALSDAYRTFRNGKDAIFKTYAHHCIYNALAQYIAKRNREKNRENNYNASIDFNISDEDNPVTVADITPSNDPTSDEILTEKLVEYKYNRLIEENANELESYVFRSLYGFGLQRKPPLVLSAELGIPSTKVNNIRYLVLYRIKSMVGDMTAEELMESA